MTGGRDTHPPGVGGGGGLIHPFLHPLLRHWGWVTATCLSCWYWRGGGGGGGLIHPFLHPLLRHWGWMTATCVHFYILAHFLFNSSGGFSVHPQALLGSTYLCCPRNLRALPPSAPAGGWGGAARLSCPHSGTSFLSDNLNQINGIPRNMTK